MMWLKRNVALLILIGIGSAAWAKTSAIVEYSHTKFTVYSATSLVTHVTTRITILNSDGYKHAIGRTYYDKFVKLRSMNMVVYDAQGKKVKKLTKGDALDIMYNDSGSIDDTRRVILDPKYQSYPFTVELEIESHENGFINIGRWTPFEGFDVEVKNSTLTFRCPATYEYRTFEQNGMPKGVESLDGSNKVLSWSMKDLPAPSMPVSMKIFMETLPRVYIAPINFSLADNPGSFKTWKEFGDWYLQLNAGRNNLSDQTKAALDKILVDNKGNMKNTIAAVYRFMQGRTRYISIQLGIGGLQSIPADVVDKTGYGDCKALSNYMKAMLEYVGIQSNYVLVNAGPDAPAVYDIPVDQFNHVFLGIPAGADTLWLECTSQISPPFHIGQFTDDRNVLWVASNGSKLVRSPKYRSSENVVYRKALMNVTAKGDARASVQIEKTGVFFDDQNYYKYLAKDDVEKFNYSKYSYKDFNISNWSYQVPDPSVPFLRESLDLTVTRLAQIVQDKVLVPFNPLVPLEKSFDMDQNNKIVEVSRAFTIEDRIEIVLPESYHSDFIPTALKERNEFGQIEMTINTNEANNVVIYKKAVFEKGLYKGETYDRFNAFLKKIRQAEQSKIVYKGRT